jgi:ribosomal protein S12 methylthiotransferase RimO
VDAEELAGRLVAGGFVMADEPTDADTILVNTCGFIDAAKKDSIDQILAAAELRQADGVKHVVVAGCLAERYGAELAAELPEADAVLGFDDYPEIAERLRRIASGGTVTAHQPQDRRGLLPISPASRQRTLPDPALPEPGYRKVVRSRLDNSPSAALKIASGCDRRCAFCAIPAFRGAYLSKPPADVVAEARWLVDQGVKEVLLVSENSTSYGKDLPGVQPAQLLAELSHVDGLEWIRMTYLQPAELRPALIDAICGTEHVLPYFDLPFQHAAAPVLRRMRRFGDAESFLELLESIRSRNLAAGIRTNVIVGFPGETESDLEELAEFLTAARLDAIGVFGYSNEEGTEGYSLDGQLDADEIAGRVEWITSLVDELMAQRAEDRIAQLVPILVEGADLGRAAQQGPSDGITRIEYGADAKPARRRRMLVPGDLVLGKVVANDGVDLVAELTEG